MAAGGWRTVLRRSDGWVVLCGNHEDVNGEGGRASGIPILDRGVKYTKVAAGMTHTLLLRSDGTAVGCGNCRVSGAWDIPALDGTGLTYVDMAAGEQFSVLIRSDGTAVPCGNNAWGQCSFPAFQRSRDFGFPGRGLLYTQAAAGCEHTVLLRSNGTAVAFGSNDHGQCNIPALDEGLHYTHVAAGGSHTVLLRSDGTAVACGHNLHDQCSIPTLDGGLKYIHAQTGHSLLPAMVLQASFDGTSMHFVTLGGQELYHIEATTTDRLADIWELLLNAIGTGYMRVTVLLPGGDLLSTVLSAQPEARIGVVFFRAFEEF